VISRRESADGRAGSLSVSRYWAQLVGAFRVHPHKHYATTSPKGSKIYSSWVDYFGWPRRRPHSPRAERMKVKPPSPPSAQSVQTKKKPPADLAISA